jgi:hypothetical protein
MSDPQKYSVTIYVAAPGTPLAKEEPGATSTPGHMFYTISDGVGKPQSFGFAPIEHGSIDGPGFIPRDDVENYKDPLYSRTMEISKEQYEKLKEFGERPQQHGFDLKYKDVRNNCVDFTWAGLNHAGIQRQNHIEISAHSISTTTAGPSIRIPLPGHSDGKSAFRPAQNVDDVKSIQDPIPGSQLNKEHANPMPHRRPLQWMLSDRGMDDPNHPGYDMYKQAYAGVAKLNAQHDVAPSERDKDFAAALAVQAKAQGLDRIDHVLLSPDGSKSFAVQGNLKGGGMDRQIAGMLTVEAIHTPAQQSALAWDQAAEQGRQAQAQAQQHGVAQSQAQQQGPAMTLS